MRKSMVDHLWSKIADLDAQGKSAAEHKLAEVVALGRAIQQAEGGEVASNLMSHGLIEVALLRCKEIQDGVHPGLCYDDLQIYFRYATHAMLEAEKAINEELPGFGG